jgi:chaperone modulatory protein CbpM
MTRDEDRIFEARIVDDTTFLHVDELCSRLRIERQWIVELVELGALEPYAGDAPSAWAFPATEVPRLRAMTRLVEDLGVNLPGAALILELVEERRRLLAQLRQVTGD